VQANRHPWRPNIHFQRRSRTPSRLGASRRQGFGAEKIALGGDSAGGALLQDSRDAGEDLPGCAWLVSPWTGFDMSGSTLETKDIRQYSL
jgi:acetyl esterase/lipase